MSRMERDRSRRHRPPLLRHIFGALIALSLLASAASAMPLPPGAHVSRPCRGPAVTDVPMSRSVDAFVDAVYDVDLEARGGQLSQLLKLRYDDGVELYLRLDDIGDESMDAAAVIREVIDHGAVCDGGRVFPRRMNRSTTPRLWSLRREALQLMDDHNAAFILGRRRSRPSNRRSSSTSLGRGMR